MIKSQKKGNVTDFQVLVRAMEWQPGSILLGIIYPTVESLIPPGPLSLYL